MFLRKQNPFFYYHIILVLEHHCLINGFILHVCQMCCFFSFFCFLCFPLMTMFFSYFKLKIFDHQIDSFDQQLKYYLFFTILQFEQDLYPIKKCLVIYIQNYIFKHHFYLHECYRLQDQFYLSNLEGLFQVPWYVNVQN